MNRRRRYGRPPRKKRSFWSRAVIVLSILFIVNWGRTGFHAPLRQSSGRNVDEGQPSKSGDIGQGIEDAIAGGLLSFGSKSAELQMASGQIYWSRARQTKDPVYLKKAEDGFNEAIRIGLDADDEKQAREILNEIAALRTVDDAGLPRSDGP